MNPELIMTNTAGLTSIIALWLYAVSNFWKSKSKIVLRIAFVVLASSFVCVTGALIFRGLEANRFPVANMYESLLLFAWGLLISYLALSFKFKMGQFGWICALFVSSVFLYASWLPPSQQSIEPLMPALVSNWRIIHVPPLIVSYALLVFGGLVSITHLWKVKRIKTALSCIGALAVSLACIYMGSSNTYSASLVQLTFWGGTFLSIIVIAFCLSREWNLPIVREEAVSKIDELSQRCITIAFPLLTFGIITGAFWANHAWGAYWSWDPKESMSLVTWLFYAAYLHLRSQFPDREDLASVIAVIGLLATLLTYLGFNFLGFGGLHSYGQIK